MSLLDLAGKRGLVVVAARLVRDAGRAMTGNTAYVDGGYHIVG